MRKSNLIPYVAIFYRTWYGVLRKKTFFFSPKEYTAFVGRSGNALPRRIQRQINKTKRGAGLRNPHHMGVRYG